MTHRQPPTTRDSTQTAAIDRSLDFSPLTRAKALIFLAAGLSFLMSVYLYFSGEPQRGVFVGLWVPSILAAGILLIAGRRHE